MVTNGPRLRRKKAKDKKDFPRQKGESTASRKPRECENQNDLGRVAGTGVITKSLEEEDYKSVLRWM